MEKLRVVELCSGIGCQLRGIEDSGCFEPDVVATSEIDISAIISYAAIHCGLTEEKVDRYEEYYPDMAEMRRYLTNLNIGYQPEKDKKYSWYKNGKSFERKVKKTWLACMLTKNFGDISRIETLPDADIWFISTPCTDISLAGKLKGLAPDSETRSSLIWHTVRLLNKACECCILPKFMILENVKNLVGKKFLPDFMKFNEIIGEYGYNVYWKVINGKNTGIPQNRERVFAIYIKKDIDKGAFQFPEPFDNGKRLIDILEEDVDDSYFIKNDRVHESIKKWIEEGKLESLNAV